MVYKNLKESPEKQEIRNSENTEKSEMSEEENTNANQRSEITAIPEFPEPKRGKALKRKGAHKEETEPAHKITKLPTRESKTIPKRDQEFIYRVKSDNGDKVSELEEDETIFAGLAEINQDPPNYREAIESPEKANWKKAIEEELQSMKENDVWKIEDRPTSTQRNRKQNIIDSNWVFKRKMDKNGLKKFMARLVIRGFKDKNVYELRETYAPVSRVIRTSLAIINKYDLDAVQLDVKTAFLNGTFTERKNDKPLTKVGARSPQAALL